MIRITKKGDYAVYIMGCLAQRTAPAVAATSAASARVTSASVTAAPETLPPQLCSAQEVAEATRLSKPLVANLLKDLTRANLLESVRGLRGGYRLAVPAESISLAAILQAVEGPFQLVDCATQRGDTDGTASHAASPAHTEHDCTYLRFCPTRSPMRNLHARIARMLEDVKLPELIGTPLMSVESRLNDTPSLSAPAGALGLHDR